jgi:hypothetical protein
MQPSCPGWRELDLRLRPWDKATNLQIEKSKLTESEKSETDEVQRQENAHNFLCDQGEYSQWIRPGSSNSQLRILLSRFGHTVA